jgi:hypothetical protein
MHKFRVGQIGQFRPDRNEIAHAAKGPYEVIEQLPHNGREYEYRIKRPKRRRRKSVRNCWQ